MKICLLVSILSITVVFFTSSAVGNPVVVTSVEYAGQDGISLAPGNYDEGGDPPPQYPFPVGERFISSWEFTPESACSGYPYDNPNIPNVLVTITDVDYGRSQPLWYVADPDTTLTNYDMRVNGSLAFKIDNAGLYNHPLVYESLVANNLFDPGETWKFIIQDFVSGWAGPAAPFDSLGIAAASAGCPSTGSIIPEPAMMSLLVIGGFALLRRRNKE